MKTTKIILLLTLSLLVGAVNAQTESVNVPAEVRPFVPFVEEATRAIALESADLNGDGMKDYVLVLEKRYPPMDEDGLPQNQRPLLILLRGKDKKLTEAARSETVVMCSRCGGVFGDPFSGLEVGKNTFTVNHYGGSSWRWTANYTFKYSRIDKTWQLVRVEKTSFHTSEPEKMTRKIMTPPKDFGKVDIADFDPADYEGTEEDGDLARSEIEDELPEGMHLVHKPVTGSFGGPNSGGENEPAADSWEKTVVLYAGDDSTKGYEIKVVVATGFEASDSYQLPKPENTWSSMEPIAVFFVNVDKDPENELLILEKNMTGIGPTGNQYFYRTRVYDWDGNDFRHLETVSQNIGNADTAAKVRQKLAAMMQNTLAPIPDDDLITANSAGKVKIGMSVAQVRQAVKPAVLSRTSDGEGIALIAVKRGSVNVMTLYAGEEDRDAEVDENARVEQIWVFDKNYKTKEGIAPGMLLAYAEKIYGKVREITMSEIESREYAEFADGPKGIDFRVSGRDMAAGVYPPQSRRGTTYTPGAYISSINVTGRENPLTGGF